MRRSQLFSGGEVVEVDWLLRVHHSGDKAIATRLFVLSRLALLATVIGELTSEVKHLKGLF